MSSWSKFHEKHGNVTSKQVYGSYISDPRQYERSATRKRSMMSKVVSCLGCLVGKNVIESHGHERPGASRNNRMKENIDTRYMYNNSTSFEHSRKKYYVDNEPLMKKGQMFQLRRNRSRGNINFLQ